MSGFQVPDWGSMFVPDASLVESFLRGSIVYLTLLVLFRIILKRQAGSLGLPDVMIVVLVSECVSVALSAEAKSVPNGLAAVVALLFWNFVLDWLAYHWPWLRRRLEPEPLQLVRDGKPITEHLKRERISDDELLSQLRENGVDDVGKVKAAFLESEGTVSVIRTETNTDAETEPPPPAPQRLSAPPTFERAVERFVAAAEAVQAAVLWHDERAADHRAAAQAARAVLTRHGIRPRRSTSPRSDRRANQEPAAVAPSPTDPAEARPRLGHGPEAEVPSPPVPRG